MTVRNPLRQVARLHAAAIDQGFLSTLGEDFLALMYEAIAEGPESFLLTEERDGRIVGFVSCGVGMRPIYSRLLSRPVRLVRAIAPTLLRPAKLWRILEILRYSRGKALPADLPAAELLTISVAHDLRGQGVAQRLYRRMLAEFLGRGIRSFRIVVGGPLEPAHRFYRKMGAVAFSQIEVHAGEPSVVYVHQL